MKRKKSWNRFPEQSVDLDENTHWSIQQGWMAIFVPFVPLAAIAAVLSQVTDVDLLARYESALSQARQAENQVMELCEQTGRPCAEASRHLKTMGRFKSEAEYGQLLMAGREIESWWPGNIDDPARIAHDERRRHVAGRLRTYVAENLGLKPRELEKETYQRIDEESERIVEGLELALWTDELRQVGAGAILTPCDLREKEDLSERARKAELLPRIESYLDERVDMMDPPSGDRAAGQRDERVQQLFQEELARLDREDAAAAEWVNGFSFQEELDVCLLASRDRAESAARVEILNATSSPLGKRECWGPKTRQAFEAAVHRRFDQQIAQRDLRLSVEADSVDAGELGEMEPEQRADPDAFKRQVVERLHVLLGVDGCAASWGEALPKTAAAITQRAEAHSVGWEAILRERLEQTIESVDSLKGMDSARRSELVVAAANLPGGAEAVPGLDEAVRSFATATGMDNVLLEEDWYPFREHFLALVAREAEAWRTSVTRAIETAPRPREAGELRVSDHTRRESLIREIAEEILTEVEDSLYAQQALVSDPRLLENARDLAERRAGNILDQVLVVSRDALNTYAEPILNTRISGLSVERLTPETRQATIDQVIRGIFPVPDDHEEESIRGTRYEQLTEDILADLRSTAGEHVESRLRVLRAEAERKIREILHVDALAPVTLATLGDWQTLQRAKRAAEAEIRAQIGAYSQLEEVHGVITEQAAALFERHRKSLYDAGFAPALLALRLRPHEYRDPCDLLDLDQKVGTLAGELIARGQEVLRIRGEFAVSEELRSLAESHARSLLSSRLDEVVQAQLEIGQGKAVEVEIYSDDTVETLLTRELAALFEGQKCVIPKVDTQIREQRRGSANQRIEELHELLAELKRVEDELAQDNSSGGQRRSPVGESPRTPSDRTVGSSPLGRRRSMEELQRILASGEATIQGMQERILVRSHVDDVEIKSEWFLLWNIDKQEALSGSQGDHLHLSEYRRLILEAAGLSVEKASGQAINEADELARKRLILYGEGLVKTILAGNRDRVEAKKLYETHGVRIVERYRNRIQQDPSVLAMEEDKLKKEILDSIDAKRFRPGVREYLADLIARDVREEQFEQRQKIRMEMASWNRGIFEGKERREDLARILKKFDGKNVSPKALAEIIKVLKDVFKEDGHSPEILELELFSADLNRHAERIGTQLAMMLSQGQYTAYLEPPPAGSSLSSAPSTSSGSSGGSPSTSGRQGQRQAGTQQPGYVPSPQSPPVPPPIDVVIAIHQPDVRSSATEVTIWEYNGSSYTTQPIGDVKDLSLIGSATQENFTEWAGDLRTWLSGARNSANGLAGAVSQIFSNRRILANEMTIRVHVAISGDALPQGFARLISEDVVPTLSARFQQRNNINSMESVTLTTWDPTNGQRLSIVQGPENLAPSRWPPMDVLRRKLP